MPTKNPRINVTLSPSLDLVLGEMADLTRSSKSSVIRGVLEGAEPALVRAVALMRAADTAHREVRLSVADGLQRAQDKAEAQLASLFAAADAATGDLVAQAETIRERRPRPASAVHAAAGAPDAGRGRARGLVVVPKDPPPSNRGVKTSNRGETLPTSGGRK